MTDSLTMRPTIIPVPLPPAGAEGAPEFNRAQQFQKSVAPATPGPRDGSDLTAADAEGAPEFNQAQQMQKSSLAATPAPSDPSGPLAVADQEGRAELTWLQRLEIPHSEYLCDQQLLAIHLLLAGHRESKVAEKIGVCRQTIRRWRNDFHFRSALAAGRKLAFGAAIDRLRSLVPEAVDRVEEQLDSRNPMAPFRLLRLAGADRADTDT